MKKKEIKLYNALFPMYLLWAFPPLIIVLLPANFVLDSIVLMISLSAFHLPKGTIYKRTIVAIWGFGFLADFIGSAFLFFVSRCICDFIGTCSLFEESIQKSAVSLSQAIEYNPFSEVLAFLITLTAIAISGLCIYKFNAKWTFKDVDINTAHKKRIALVLAIVTAPYMLLLPSILFF